MFGEYYAYKFSAFKNLLISSIYSMICETGLLIGSGGAQDTCDLLVLLSLPLMSCFRPLHLSFP